uniref:BTB domain-containing protein n=1 Tax=Parastrongyloides trichosuri TaxID=131310 RepID=A0A0N5A5B4_PARTI
MESSNNKNIIARERPLTPRDAYFMKVLDIIEKEGHCLTPTELEHTEMFLSGDKLPKKYYDLGRSAFLYYLHTYNLTFEDAFDNTQIEAKDDFIKLVFHDGNLVATKTFLTSFFKYFEMRFNFDRENDEKVIHVEDFSYKHFLVVMKYFYGKRISFDLNNIVELYRLSSYFIVESTFFNRLVDYVKYFFPKLMKTRAFYENLTYFENGYLINCEEFFYCNNIDDLYDMKRLLYLYRHKHFQNNLPIEPEALKNGNLKYRYDVPMSYAVIEVVTNSINRIVLNRIGGYGNGSEYKFTEEYFYISEIMTRGSEIFVFFSDGIKHSLCHLKLIGNEKSQFTRYSLPIELCTKLKIIPYKDRFIVLKNCAAERPTRNLGDFDNPNRQSILNDKVTFQIFEHPSRIYTENNNPCDLFEPEEDQFDKFTMKDLNFNIRRRSFHDYFVFESEDYIYFLLIVKPTPDETSFFRINISTTQKEILDSLNTIIDPISVCNYNSTLFFLLKPKREDCTKSCKKESIKTVEGFCFDLKKNIWRNYKQPFIDYSKLDVSLEIVNGIMHFYIIKKRSDYKKIQETILYYTPDEESCWTEVRNKVYDTPHLLEEASYYYRLIRRPGF